VPAIEGARRWEIEPVEVACVRETELGAGESAATVALGRAGGAAIVLLRFSLALPPDSDVLEAYVLLDRATDFEADPIPVSLHAERIQSPWSDVRVCVTRARHGRERSRGVARPCASTCETS
jgi:hypothetical protein